MAMVSSTAPRAEYPSFKDLKKATIHVSDIEVSDSEAESDRSHFYDLSATHLITSPYSDFANQTRLVSLSLSCRLLAFALAQMAPIRSDYATASYLESFNWGACFATLRRLCARSGLVWQRQEFYVVIFRSRSKRGADRVRLGELDQHSHAEACQSGGLLKYWFGDCDGEMRNLATCRYLRRSMRDPTDDASGLWRAREDAVAGGKGPWHAKAMRSAVEMYESITFHRHTLVIDDGAESWRLDDYVDPDSTMLSKAHGH